MFLGRSPYFVPPLVSCLLQSLDLAFEVAGFVIGLSKVVISLSQGLVSGRRLGLFFEELKSSSKGFILLTMLRGLSSSSLGFLQGSLKFLDSRLEQLIAVGEGGDLLLLREVVLLHRLDFGFDLFGRGNVLVRFDVEWLPFRLGIDECCRRYGEACCRRGGVRRRCLIGRECGQKKKKKKPMVGGILNRTSCG